MNPLTTEKQPACKLFVVDATLGTREDDAHDQLLAAWPTASGHRTSKDFDIVRMARGSMALCTTFDAGNACDSISFEQHSIIVHETEASILWILYAPRANGGFRLSPRLARRCLAQLSALFCLLHRSVLQLMQLSGLLTCRSLLDTFLKEYMPVFEGRPTGSWCTMHDLYAAMSPHRGLPLTIIAGETFRGIQALVSSLASAQVVPDRDTLGCMVLHKQAVLHTNLSAADAAPLYLFASSTLIPVTRAENKTTRTLHQLYHNVTDWSMAADSPLAGSSWRMAKGGDHTGLLTYGSESASRPGLCPLLFASGGESCRLVAWQRSGFQILVLVNGEGSLHAGELAAARRTFLELLSDLDRSFAATLPDAKKAQHCFVNHVGKLVTEQAKGHIAGDRYTLTDETAAAPLCSSTPASKLAASKSLSSQAVVAQLWGDAQDHMDALAAPATAATPGRAGAASENAATAQPGSDGLGQTDSRLSAASARSGSAALDGAEAWGRAPSVRGKSPGRQPPESGPRRSPPRPPSAKLAGQRAGHAPQATGQAGRRLEVAALTPDGKWVAARWAMGAELLHVDDGGSGDSAALAAAWKKANHLLDGHFPGVMGI